MASDLWNICLNIIAAFIYAGIVWAWNRRGRARASLPSVATESYPAPEVALARQIDRRVANQQMVGRLAYKFVFYLFTFSALYLSVTIPPLFKALFAVGDLLLSDARAVGTYLPPLPVGKSYLQFTFFVLAAILYFPLLFLAQAVAILIFPLVDAFKRVTGRMQTAITMAIFLLCCIPIAALSTWLFFDKSYMECLGVTLLFFLLPFAVGQAQSGRR